MRSRRSFDPDAAIRALRSRGEDIAKHYGVPLTDVQYVRVDYHNGTQWTIRTGWQRRLKGEWVEVDWEGELPTTPKNPYRPIDSLE